MLQRVFKELLTFLKDVKKVHLSVRMVTQFFLNMRYLFYKSKSTWVYELF